MDAPSPPPAPDPREIARTDAEFNRINQFTPFGNLTFSGPNRNNATLELTPELQANTDLRLESDSAILRSALERQGLLNANPIDLSQFGDIQSGIDTSNISFSGPQFGQRPDLQAPELVSQLQTGNIPTDISQFRGDVEQAVFDRGRALLDPVFSDQERALEQRLANQGLPRAGEAVDRDLERFGRGRNEAFTNLANQATITGGQEASRALGDVLSAENARFGQGATAANFANQAGLLGLGANQGIRSQLTGEQLAESQANNAASQGNLSLQQQILNNQNAARAQSLAEQQGIRGNQFNELASLMGLQQVQAPGINSFFAPGQADVTNAFALNQQAQQNAFNANSQNHAAGLGGLFGLGAAALGGPFGGALFGGGGGGGGVPNVAGFSDIRLKENIEHIGWRNGHKIYRWQWNELAEELGIDDSPTVGVIAQEVMDTGYVYDVAGILMVDYEGLWNG